MEAEPEPAREIVLQNPNRYAEVDGTRLRVWLREMLAEVAPGDASLAVRFVGARAMRALNRDFRGKDAPTDVLSFPGETTPEGEHLGDLVICVPVACRQAGGEPRRELRRLVLHGVLHCLGYDHDTDHGEMRRLESRLRRRWIERDA